mgnify:CR=1 FL=1
MYFLQNSGRRNPSATLYEDDDFRVILDLGPASKGHALILPKEHYRNLFDLDDENYIYETKGLQAYSEYQLAHEQEILKPGSGFALVKALLKLNESSKKRRVEVLIMSRNSADTSLRIFTSIAHYGLDITRAVLSGGGPLTGYLKAFGVDLFLSANEEDVRSALAAGFAAGRIYTNAIEGYDPLQGYRSDPDCL